ncbi:TIGR03032 family protein [Rhodoferax sp.]|uniref:TIGR03032 family protein n=1 Tax=Rhodoferax sp. TaxID=50421 RepID=UPI00284ADEB7|nr:TIGR03032 family protein [Rhodoferax sp.]MDR3368415.1 TIGR03032 family protein [Rhodoferax sp.]
MGKSASFASPFPNEQGSVISIYGDIVDILDQLKVSLVVSTDALRLFCLGAEHGQLSATVIPFHNPFGVNVLGNRLVITSRRAIAIFNNAPHMAASYPADPNRYDAVFAPRAVYLTGNCRAHDIQISGESVIFANTQFSCIAHCNGTYSFSPLWQPSFISELMPEDRCHLNGFAFHNDRVVFATAFAPCDTPRGYRNLSTKSGVLMDVISGDIAVAGLTLPHSPRLFDEELFVCNSGFGDVLKIDIASRKADIVARLPGFTRGLRTHGDFLFVGLSNIRSTRREIPLLESKVPLLSGIAVIEKKTGKIRGWLELPDSVNEVLDFDLVPGFRQVLIQDTNEEGGGYCAVETPVNSFWTPIEGAFVGEG